MQHTVATLRANIDTLNAQSTQLATQGLTMSDANAQITQMGAQIRSMDACQEKETERLKALMRDDLMRVTIRKLECVCVFLILPFRLFSSSLLSFFCRHGTPRVIP
ncbi:hypothetical protein FIBSPDRAFT_855088 [Athelia psychrophila]|uniref:Uncharacterized protein n=1 Tax=Athelia psychrophila TaxID=1759441 RepID=A0A166PIQ8_9AGAM|nr:hypothetical protein FIBSPDRAFT_855088 [Fibularhizoctonia sp. CBS 109695]